MQMSLVDGLTHEVQLSSCKVLERCWVCFVGLIVKPVPAEYAHVGLVEF